MIIKEITKIKIFTPGYKGREIQPGKSARLDACRSGLVAAAQSRLVTYLRVQTERLN